MEQVVYMTCDSLHKAIGLLETVRQHICKLEIYVWVEDMHMSQDEALAAVQALLHPFG